MAGGYREGISKDNPAQPPLPRSDLAHPQHSPSHITLNTGEVLLPILAGIRLLSPHFKLGA